MSVKINVLISWMAHAVTLGVGFFLMPYILFTVGDGTYGTWLFLNSIAGQTGLLYLGFGDAISRFTSKYQAEKNWAELNRTASCITSVYFGSACVAMLFGTLFALIAPWIYDWPGQSITEVQIVIVLLTINAAVSIGGSSFGGMLMGMQRFDVERSIVIAVNLARLVLTLLFLKSTYGLITLAGIFLSLTILENVAMALMAFRIIPTLRLRFSDLKKSVYKRCFSFSLFTFLSLIAEHIIYMTDTILIGYFLGPVAVVPYYIAFRLCNMVRIPILQIGYVFLPKAGELHSMNQNERLRKLVSQGFGIAFLLICSAFIGACFFSDLMIHVWIGSGYVESYLIVLILLGGQLVALPTHLMRYALVGTGYVRTPAFLFLIEAVANLVISLSLLPYWGIYGVAVGTLIPLIVVELGLMLPLGMRQLKLTAGELFTQGLRPQLIPLMMILMYCIIVYQLHPQANWLHVAAIALGANIVLLLGIGLVYWKKKVQKIEHIQEATAVH